MIFPVRKKYLFQPEYVYLLPVFSSICKIYPFCAPTAGTGEQQKENTGRHYQWKNRFVSPTGLEQQVTSRHIILALLKSKIVFELISFRDIPSCF